MQLRIQDDQLHVFMEGTYLTKDNNAVAIVGARKMSSRGEQLAYQFSYALAKAGITIVSGLALGIDTVAHSAALAAGGRTIAVLAHGLDQIYPQANTDLAQKITQSGCLMTKFKRGTLLFPSNFLARNQLIAGLSKAVLVIEGQSRSGSLSTANHAANLGIEVFAVPGSPATDFLIDNGADIAHAPQDLIDYLQNVVY